MSQVIPGREAGGWVAVSLDESGAGSALITWPGTFVAPPDVHITPNAADKAQGAVITVQDITVRQARVVVSGSALRSTTVLYRWTATEMS